ncbi:MAG: hypothetical protein FJ253_12210, partial [Phycisphaerae bacterium]|nr:hypothetical protein [Phycisphaerae bacterium]
MATEAGISTFQLGKIERGEAGRRPTQKMASAIETLVTRYNIVAPRPPGARDPGPEAPPVVAALNSVPREIADAVEQLWQG